MLTDATAATLREVYSHLHQDAEQLLTLFRRSTPGITALDVAENIRVNKLFEEFATLALAEFDAHTRFRARFATGSRETGLRLLDRLDAEESAKGRRVGLQALSGEIGRARARATAS